MAAPVGGATRPTSDRVREAMFSILTSMDLLEGAAVLDLFAGSGALGVEALSRGCGRVTFVDSSQAALRSVRANLEVIPERAGDAEIVHSDVLRFMERSPGFDLALADPPYRFSGWPELLAALLGKVETVMAETDRTIDIGSGWETVKVRKYGSTVVTVAKSDVTHRGPVRREGEI